MKISEVGTFPSPEFSMDWIRYTANPLWWIIAVRQSIIHTLNGSSTIELPVEALSTVWGYTAIKSTWLNANFPLYAWKKAGGVDPILFSKIWNEDWNKPLVWVQSENWITQYFCNQEWEELIAKIYDGYIEENPSEWDTWNSPTKIQYNTLKEKWFNNVEIIQTLWLVRGFRHENNSRLQNWDYAVVRSRSPRSSDKCFHSVWINENHSSFFENAIWGKTGVSPRVFLGKKPE